ncbi:MAG TPA: helix-turn-helix domain-containing protein [Caulobacteraceae bacterium]|nr:helix-turn-helix domain-containing protein [Caulobacteraceae bacterium]
MEEALATIQRLSTSSVARPDRLAYWNEASTRSFGAMVVDADPDGFQATLTRLRTDRFELVSVSSTPAVTRSAAREVRARGDDSIFRLQLVHTGGCLMRHNGLETVVGTGDLVIADVSKSYDLAFGQPLHGLTAPIPWPRFSPFAERLEALTGHRLRVGNRAAAVLSNFLRSTWDHLAEGDGEDWPASAEDVIWDLLEAALRGDAAGEMGGGRTDRLRLEAKTLVDARLSDPSFSPSAIAEALGISARYLQMVFAEVGTTPSRFLLARRLEAAAARLRRPDAPISITEVGLECGFNDLSYFSRTFRRRFGLSPLTYRTQVGNGSTVWQ